MSADEPKRRCTKCKVVQVADEFVRDASRASGRHPWCRTCQRAVKRAYARRNPPPQYVLTPQRRERARRYGALFPERRRAHRAVWRAVKRGLLVRPIVCPQCGRGGRIQAHHDDYSKPLEVRWLCQSCHAAEHHKDTRIAENGPHGET